MGWIQTLRRIAPAKRHSGKLQPNGAATGSRSRGDLGNARYFNAYAGSAACPTRIAYLCPPPPPEPFPLDALPAEEEALVPDETDAVEEETELVEVDMAPEYPEEVCDIPA